MKPLKAIYALYSEPDSAERAFNSLRVRASGLGIETRDIAVESSEPFDEHAFGRPETGTRMPWLAALGGVIGATSGFCLASWTQKAYPIPTGGMPIVTLWTDGIITYESTMLGAILATLFTLLVSAGLPNFRSRLYDPEISNGKILVGVINPPEGSRSELEKALRDAGAESVRDSARDPTAIVNPKDQRSL